MVIPFEASTARNASTALAIDALLTSSELSTAEKGCLASVLGDRVRPGRYVSPFTASLFDSMLLAIPSDLDRLSNSYPEEVAAHRSRRSGVLTAKAEIMLGELGYLLN